MKTKLLKTSLFLALMMGLGTAWGQSSTQTETSCVKVTSVIGNATTVTYYDRLTTANSVTGALNAVGSVPAGAAASRKVFTIELLWPDTDSRLTNQYTLDNMTTFSTGFKDITIKTADEVGSPATIKRGSGMTGNVTMLALNIATGTLTFNNIVLDGLNIACTGSGAVLRVQNGTVNINSGAVLKNGNTSGNGGLVNVSGGTLNINSGALLQDGVSSGTGGLVNVSGGALYIDGATLQDGTASAGALINKAGAGVLSISNMEINGGSATSTLINIASGAGATTMTNTIINGQSATGTLISDSGTGAMTFTGCAINGSTTAASNTLISKSSTGAVTFTNTTITRNQSKGYGFVNSSTGTVTFDGCTIDGSNNTAATNSLIKTNTGVLSFKNTTVTGHTVSATNVCAVDASSADGAADTKIYTGTKIIGNTSRNRPANLKISGTTFMYIYDPLTEDIGITNQRNNHNNAQFGYSNPTSSIGAEHLINDLTTMLTATQSSHVIKWVMDSNADPLDDMFGFPDYTVNDLITQPSAADLAAVPTGAIPGIHNDDPTNPYMIWKSVAYNNDHSVDITFNYFQKQVGLKLDFIFMIDETGTMHDNKTANGYTMSQGMWARRAALEAAKGVLQINTDYGYNDMNNRVRFISFAENNLVGTGFIDNYEEARDAINYTITGSSTYHSVGINAATAAALESKADGHQPIVVYLSDYQLHFRIGTETSGNTYIKPSEMNALKEAADAIYALLVYQDWTQTISNRMSLLTPSSNHYWMEDMDDPSTLITPFINIIHDAIAHCGKDLVVEDGLANGLIPAAGQNTVTSTNVGNTTQDVTYNDTDEALIWPLNNGQDGDVVDNRLNTGEMYTIVVNIPLMDDVYSGSMITNTDMVVENDGIPVNEIPSSDSPITRSPLVLLLKGDDTNGSPLAGATFQMTHGSLSWTLTTDSEGKIVLPWGESDVVGASTEASTFVFNTDDEYILTQLTTIDGYVRPGGFWTLSVGSDDYKITPITTQGTGSVNRTLDMVAVSGKFEIYNDTEPTVIYVANGGQGNPIEVPIDFANNETSHPYTTLTAAESGFTYDERTLVGWNTEGDGSGTSYALGATITLSRGEDEDIELFAQWSGEPIIARVSNDNGITWTMHSYLVNNAYDPDNDSPELEGAFNKANTLDGDVIIETLYEHHNRYTLTESFTFDKEEITSLTLRTTQNDSWNPETADGRFTSTIYRGVTSYESLITFNFPSNPTITIEKITFDGGYDAGAGYYCGGNGGLIFAVHVVLDINDVTFQNTMAYEYGGALYAIDYDTNVSFYGTVAFIDCSAGYGGGFYGDATIHGPISFTNCSANYDGGGIYGGVSCESSVTFTNCSASQNGGGIYIGDSNGPFSFSGPTTFTGCTANQDGGGIYVYPPSSEVIFSNVATFTNCTAVQDGGGIGTSNDVKVTFTNTENDPDITATFKGCTAAGSGGGIKAYNIELGENVQLLLGGEDDESCSAHSYGGGVYCFGTFDALAGNVTITATNCTADVSGGGIYVEYNFTLDGNATFTGCEADEYGGGMYCGGTFDASASNVTIIATNCAAANGGGIYSGDAFTIGGNATFTGCTATRYNGGGIYAHDFTLNGEAEFLGCSAGDNGGGIYAYNFTLNSNATFTTCQAENGGGIYADNFTMNDNASLTMGGTETGQGCMAENNGGGIYSYDFDATADNIQILMTNCTTINADGGGGIYAENKVEINGENCIAEFKNCVTGTDYLSRPDPYGGGIYGREVILNGDISFDGCQSGNFGGAIAGETISLDGNIEITDCYAKVNGGGIYASGDANLAGNISITGCSTGGFGGGIYLTSDASLTVSGIIIVEDNTHGTGDNTVADDVYLNETNYKYITIGDDGLLCGSHIGVYKVEIEYYCEFESDNNNIPYTDIVQGANANCLFAFHNGFFFDDNNLYGVYYMGNYDPYAEGTIYFIDSWEGQASLAVEDDDYVLDGDYVAEVITAEGLAYFAKDVNSGKDYSGKTVTLNNDIDLSDHYWVPIGFKGFGTCTTNDQPFSGIFNGQGYIISNIMSILPYKAMGLFGYVDHGTVTNTFIESGELLSTYSIDETVTDDAVCVGGLVGMMEDGNISYSEVKVHLTNDGNTNCFMGGLVGWMDNNTIHSSMAMPEMTDGTFMGGIAGVMAQGNIENSFANPKFNIGSDMTTWTVGGLAGSIDGTSIENCYAMIQGTAPTAGTGKEFGWLVGHVNDYTIQYCYIPEENSNYFGGGTETTPSYIGTYTSPEFVDGKYGFRHRDLQMEVEGISAEDISEYNDTPEGGLTAILNSWVDDQGEDGYARWSRTMASPINGDYPILMLPDFESAASLTDSIFIVYGDVNNLIEYANDNTSNGGGNVYLYGGSFDEGVTITQSTENNVRLYIHEDVGVEQDDNVTTINARVGVTFKNDRDDESDTYWHAFASAINNVPTGIVYHTGEDSDYVSFISQENIPDSDFNSTLKMDPPKTTWNTTQNLIGYFPTNTPYGTWREEQDDNGFFDFYAYYEPYYHWVNLKREGSNDYMDHWHIDTYANGDHPRINYKEEADNSNRLINGKGYLMALSAESMMMADGQLNNGNVNVKIYKTTPGENTPTGNAGGDTDWRSVNLVGNPYQSYLNFDKLYENGHSTIIENTFAVRDDKGKEYLFYTYEASDNAEYSPSNLIHPHQGFFVKVKDDNNSGSYDLTFNNDMRVSGNLAEDNPFRGYHCNYPLINLLCFDSHGHRDLTTVEVNRPELGGGQKMFKLVNGDALLYAHLEGGSYQTLFTPLGIDEVPIRFKAMNNGVFTLQWNTLHGDFHYLHLIDNITGADIDMLSTEEYRFEGRTSDYTSRFKLVFHSTGVEEQYDITTGNETFAFIHNGQLVIEGNGTLQVIDLLGRILSTYEISSDSRLLPSASIPNGVYILRLTSGSNTKTQKLIINH